jgi:hypothetical protein
LHTVSTRPNSGYVGNNVYNATAAHQTRQLRARRSQVRTFFVRVYNDGPWSSTFTVTGGGARTGAAVRYSTGPTDVTAPMRSSGGLRLRIRAHRARLITVRVQPDAGARVGAHLPAIVRATWRGDGPRTDVVRAVVDVVH